MPKVIECARIGYFPEARCWPDTQRTDYSELLAWREEESYWIGEESVTLRFRKYPIHKGYVRAGLLATPLPHPYINNLAMPDSSVLLAMLEELEGLSREGVQIIIWEHAHQCYPPVAMALKSFFAHSILWHGDDSPGTTEGRTAPIAAYFDSAFLFNVIWSLDGELTADLYHRLGVEDTHYLALSCSGGLLKRLEELHFDFEEKLRQQREKMYDLDFVFAGGLSGPYRAALNAPEFSRVLERAGIRSKIIGVRMRDGEVLPRGAYTPGYAITPLYLKAFANLNVGFIGLLATRAFDAWHIGNLLIQHSTTQELTHLGIHAGVHYADYDGTAEGLVECIRHYQANWSETEAILRAGRQIGIELPEKHNRIKALERVLNKFAHKWR